MRYYYGLFIKFVIKIYSNINIEVVPASVPDLIDFRRAAQMSCIRPMPRSPLPRELGWFRGTQTCSTQLGARETKSHLKHKVMIKTLS